LYTINTNEENNYFINILRALDITIPDIDSAPIKLNALVLKHPFSTRADLITRISNHYYRQILLETYKILGSFDIIGNPVGLFSNLGAGLIDFFYEPARGFVETPWKISIGMVKGTSSLIKNIISGTMNTASNITASLSKGLAHLSLDSEYAAERHDDLRTKPKHLGDGLLHGVVGLSKGIFDGVTGLVTQPYKGAKKDGFGGLVKGIGRGVIGVAIKPTAGVLDLATKTTQGLKNTTTIFDEVKQRKRAPRYFGPDRVLVPFNATHSKLNYLVTQTADFSSDYCVDYVITAKDCYCIFTRDTILYTEGDLTKEDHLELKWDYKFNEVDGIETISQGKIKEKLTVLIILAGKKKKQMKIECDNEETKRTLVIKLQSKILTSSQKTVIN